MSDESVRKRLGADERREEIIRVTLDLAAKQGVDDVTTQDMAQAMGLTQGAVFRHFPSKDAIWLAVMQWVRDRLMSVMDKAAQQGRDPLDALQRMFFAHIDFIAGHPAIPRVLMSEHLHGRNAVLRQLVTEIMLGYEAKIAGLLAEAQMQGLARAELDTHAAATLYIGMIQGLVLQTSILRGQRALASEAARTFPIFLQAIRPSTHQGAVP
ncbi:MAG: TetR family transcriptional regulator [Hydrogenophilales bacterium 16-64-46]|nr:MAG: TetR family transcriptional regulator [Hydrogenophilales bacterium 12-64-13]OYZ06692.1 MAG: TetR family transcriptional regulator [Hydrogenophilales bacterium 16-64-46]OZA39401.1 MAG: TetR family transcriptional regulator [Hydrogenophilales bacterium 17-64-34]HQT01400.1 TetR/AcrR family transcriptional regulator [Thiobacillus sp.]